MHCPKGTRASHLLVCVLHVPTTFIYIYIYRMTLTPYNNCKKKKYLGKKPKISLDLGKKNIDCNGYSIIKIYKKTWKS